MRIANKAFDAALEDIDTIGEECYKMVSVILQDLRDNAQEWASLLTTVAAPQTTSRGSLPHTDLHASPSSVEGSLLNMKVWQ